MAVRWTPVCMLVLASSGVLAFVPQSKWVHGIKAEGFSDRLVGGYRGRSGAGSSGGRCSTAVALDLKDILDDEVDFLAQLRRQMDNPLNASPREMTNRIKGFFSSSLQRGARPAEETEAFKKYIASNEHLMDVVNAILIVEGCGRSSIAVKDVSSWPSILSAMTRPSPLLTSSVIYRAISSARKLRPDDASTKKFLQLLTARISDSGMVLHSADICPAIYSMQGFSANMAEIRALLDLMTRSLAMSNASLSSKSVCSALFGLKKMKPVPEVRQLLAQIARKIDASDSFYHSVNVCIALNGLQTMDDSSPEVRSVLRALMRKAIPATEQGLDRASDREISMALFGLQRMGGRQREGLRPGHRSDASPELRSVLSYITSLLVHHEAAFESKRIGLSLLGLSCLSSDTPEVRAIVGALAVKAAGSWGKSGGHEMSMGLHGIRGLRSDCPEVAALAASLAPIVDSCPSLASADLSSALDGLAGLRSRSPGVAALVKAVADLIERSSPACSLGSYEALCAISSLSGLSSGLPEVRSLLTAVSKAINSTAVSSFSAKDLSSALSGIRSLSSQHPETLAITSSLADFCDAFASSGDKMPAAALCSALSGLQKLRSDHREVKRLLASLLPIAEAAEGPVSGKSLSMALNGLQGLDGKHKETLLLVKEVTRVMEGAEATFTGFADFQEISAALYGLSSMTADAPEVYRLLCVLARLIAASYLAASAAAASSSLTKDVRGEQVAAALFGLQGVSSKVQPARDILLSILPSVAASSSLRGKELGMALQGFRESAGKPPSGYDEVLSALASKIAGWTSGRRSQTSSAELQVTLRSALWGIAKLDRKHPSVRSVLIEMAAELNEAMQRGLGAGSLDSKTLNAVKEVYRGGEIESVEIVQKLLVDLGIDSVTLPPVKKWKKKNQEVALVV